mgnify:CR=1 FL=1
MNREALGALLPLAYIIAIAVMCFIHPGIAFGMALFGIVIVLIGADGGL